MAHVVFPNMYFLSAPQKTIDQSDRLQYSFLQGIMLTKDVSFQQRTMTWGNDRGNEVFHISIMEIPREPVVSGWL